MRNVETFISAINEADFEVLATAAERLPELCEALPPEEKEAYRDAQQSVIDAQDSAIRNEGQLWITD